MKNWILFLAFGGLALLSACERRPDRPNIILILADDFGYMDCQAYAQKTLGIEKNRMYYETPHLDCLSAEGISFSRAYANQLCSPTRSAIMEKNYKLIFDWHGRLKLFKLDADLGENHNLAAEMPEKTFDLYTKLINWLEENVDQQYWLPHNPDYNPAGEARTDAPFVDLYEAFKQGKDIVALAHTE